MNDADAVLKMFGTQNGKKKKKEQPSEPSPRDIARKKAKDLVAEARAALRAAELIADEHDISLELELTEDLAIKYEPRPPGLDAEQRAIVDAALERMRSARSAEAKKTILREIQPGLRDITRMVQNSGCLSYDEFLSDDQNESFGWSADGY